MNLTSSYSEHRGNFQKLDLCYQKNFPGIDACLGIQPPETPAKAQILPGTRTEENIVMADTVFFSRP